MYNSRQYAPWPYFRVSVCWTKDSSINEIVTIQAKNEGMAEFLALRKSEISSKYGSSSVESVEQLKRK